MRSGKIVATDVDDVLVHISTPWVERVVAHALVGPASGLRGRLPTGEGLRRIVEARTFPHVQEWMMEAHGVPRSLAQAMDAVYRDDPKFYDDLPTTEFCDALNTALRFGNSMEHIHVITHCHDKNDPAVQSKVRWLERHLHDDRGRVTIHLVDGERQKSEILFEHCPEPDAFVDDSLRNVVDVLLASDRIRPAEILIPRMGHNPLSPEIEQLAALRRIRIVYYEEKN